MLISQKVDFSSVIKMIDDMVALLKKEGADDEKHRDWFCILITNQKSKIIKHDKIAFTSFYFTKLVSWADDSLLHSFTL